MAALPHREESWLRIKPKWSGEQETKKDKILTLSLAPRCSCDWSLPLIEDRQVERHNFNFFTFEFILSLAIYFCHLNPFLSPVKMSPGIHIRKVSPGKVTFEQKNWFGDRGGGQHWEWGIVCPWVSGFKAFTKWPHQWNELVLPLQLLNKPNKEVCPLLNVSFSGTQLMYYWWAINNGASMISYSVLKYKGITLTF